MAAADAKLSERPPVSQVGLLESVDLSAVLWMRTVQSRPTWTDKRIRTLRHLAGRIRSAHALQRPERRRLDDQGITTRDEPSHPA